MNSRWVMWPAGVVFGFMIARVGYGIVMPPLTAEPRWLADNPGLLIVVAVIFQLVVTVAVALILVRAASLRRLLGWGCVALGCVLLLNVVSTALFSGMNWHDLMEPDTRDKSDRATAFMFWVLAVALYYVVGGLILLVVGLFLLRGGRPNPHAIVDRSGENP